MQSDAVTRHLEAAAEEVCRLDEIAAASPPAVARLLTFDSIASAAAATTEAKAALLRALVVGDLSGRSASSSGADARTLLVGEERKARSGSPPTLGRVQEWLEAPLDDSVTARLEAALRSAGPARSVMLRAIEVAALLPDGVAGRIAPALLLCAAGITDHVRLLPFAEMDPAARTEGLAAWTAGDEEPFTLAALAECARAARARRLPLRRLRDADRAGLQKLDALGRGAITARAAFAELSERLATTMPALASALACSRPAAAAALDRLVDVGLASEITGRARDRVYVHAASWDVVR